VGEKKGAEEDGLKNWGFERTRGEPWMPKKTPSKEKKGGRPLDKGSPGYQITHPRGGGGKKKRGGEIGGYILAKQGKGNKGSTQKKKTLFQGFGRQIRKMGLPTTRGTK